MLPTQPHDAPTEITPTLVGDDLLPAVHDAGAGRMHGRAKRRSRALGKLPGDLSRAEVLELLHRRQAVLVAASFAAGQFLSGDWQDGIEEALERIGSAADVSRVYIFENRAVSDGETISVQRYEWCAEGVPPSVAPQDSLTIPHDGIFSPSSAKLARGEVFYAQVEDLPDTQRLVLSQRGIISILLVPIFAGDDWWGFMGFDECRHERRWDASEVETLRLAVDLLGTAIARFKGDLALRQSEAGLRESEAELRALFAAMDDVILVLDRDGRYLKIAPTAQTLLYRAPENLLNRTLREVFPQETGEEFTRLVCVTLDTRAPQRTVYTLNIAGRQLWFEATITPLTHRTVLWVARDITEGYEANLRLEQQTRELETLFEALPDLYFRLSWDGVILDYKTSSLEALYVAPDEFLGRKMTDVLPQDVAESFQNALDGASQDRAIHTFDYSLILGQERRSFEARLWSYEDSHFYVVVRDITERREAEERLRRAEAKYRSIFENAVEGIFQTTPDGYYMDANPSLARIYGYDSPEEMTGSLTDISRQLYVDPSRRREFLRQMSESGAVSSFESQVVRRDGEIIWISENARAVYDLDGTTLFFEGTVEDITKRKVAEERLLHDALHDKLTGLANRALFMDRVGQAMGRLHRDPAALFAVLFLDCDRFKNVNDSLGHMAGDELLVLLAGRLDAALRPGDTVARLGGDEFGVLLTEIHDVADATSVAERIQKEMRVPFPISGQEVFASASIGIAIANEEYQKTEDLLRDADMAMYRAKATGKARHEVFDAGMHIRAVALLQLETDLRWAIERGEFQVYYQPIVELESGGVVGFEALVRWQHPEKGLVSPGEFIPIAEETGFIVPIGHWVLQEACRQVVEWHGLFPSDNPLSISVNLSGRQFSQPDLIEIIERVLEETGLPPRCLKLEITESAIMEHAQAVTDRLLKLRALGVRLGLDDFGTGYSSLSYLHRFPLDTLKIDRSFVSRMMDGGENREIVRTIVSLGKNLGMSTVAEGVEVEGQLAELRALHCTHGQGYYFSEPLAATETVALLKAGKRW